MRTTNIPIFLLPFLATTQVLAQTPFAKPRPIPRAIDAVLIEPGPSLDSPSPTTTPFLQHLDLRQVAAPAAAPANAQANPAANAQPAPAAKAPAAPAAAPAAAAPAPAAPAAGVGGAGAAPAAAQPPAGAGANPVTTIQVATVVGGVTKTVASVLTQTFGPAESAPAVQSGSIGLGTLTGQVGVVKTKDAKSDAVTSGKTWGGMEMCVVVISGLAALGGGVLGIAIL